MNTSRPEYLKAQDLAQLFKVSQVTIYAWLRGTTRLPPIPQVKSRIQTSTVARVRIEAAKRWAKANGIPIQASPQDIIQGRPVGRKSGPVSRVKE